MAERSLEERVRILEARLGDKALQEHFREQAELIDRRLDASFRDQAELIDRLLTVRFAEMDNGWDTRLEQKLENKLQPLRHDLAIVREGVKIILAKLEH